MRRSSKTFCAFCQRSEETEITGALSTKDEVTAHENCLAYCPICEQIEGNIRLDNLSHSITMVNCVKHAPLSRKKTNGNSTAGSLSVHSNDSSLSGRTIRTALKRPLIESVKQEESPSKYRIGDWNGMVSVGPSDSDENETKPEIGMIPPLESDLDESVNSDSEDQAISDESGDDELQEDGEVSSVDSEAEEFYLLDIPSSQSDEDWEPISAETAGVQQQEASTSGKEEPHPPTPAKSAKRGRGRGERRSPSPIDQASTSGERWNDEDVPDIEPPQIIFCPNRTPGPQLIMTENYTPVQLFQLFFSNDVLLTIVKNTNEHGSAHYSTPSKPWKNIDLRDMFCFMSMLIYMGVLKCSSYTDYWRRGDLYSLQFPKRLMTGRKFLRMIWALHLSSAAMDAENEGRRGTAAFDRLGKIKPLYDDMREACKRNYHPNQEISIDERMVASKARIGLKQYMKSKPVRWSYKLFVLADSKAGYTWDFFVYEGKSTVNTGKGISYESVMELLKPQLLGTGYKLFVDNFYTSTTLFQDLLKMKVWACGTIRTNLIGFPRTTENSLDSKSPRGSVRWIRKDSLLFVQWRDTRDVSLCSTFHRAHTGETIKRRVRSADGQWEVKDITLPPVVKDYNQHMGGVDLSDALIQFYKVLHKTRKWYKTFFYHFVDIAIVNAFLLHKELAMAKGQVPMKQKAFRETLAEDLAMMGSAPAPAPAHHRLMYISGNSTAGRLKCRNCHKKTPVKCVTCDVSLCFLPGRNCYNDWHVANNFWN